MVELLGGGHLGSCAPRPPGVDAAHDVLYRSVLAGGVEGLEHHQQPVGVLGGEARLEVGEQLQPRLQLRGGVLLVDVARGVAGVEPWGSLTRASGGTRSWRASRRRVASSSLAMVGPPAGRSRRFCALGAGLGPSASSRKRICSGCIAFGSRRNQPHSLASALSWTAPRGGWRGRQCRRGSPSLLGVARILDAAQHPALRDLEAQLPPRHPRHGVGQPLREAHRAAGEVPHPPARIDRPPGEQHPVRTGHHHLDGEPRDAAVDLPELLLGEGMLLGTRRAPRGSRVRRPPAVGHRVLRGSRRVPSSIPSPSRSSGRSTAASRGSPSRWW